MSLPLNVLPSPQMWTSSSRIATTSIVPVTARPSGVVLNPATSSRPRWARISDHGWARAKFSYFEMRSDTAGITLSPDNEDQLLRLGASIGWDTRDSWRNPRRGGQNEIELWHTGPVSSLAATGTGGP